MCFLIRKLIKKAEFSVRLLLRARLLDTGIPTYESWWDVPVAEVSEVPHVEAAHAEWAAMRAQERYFLL